MARGEKTSVYLSKNAVRLGKDLACENAMSASEVVTKAVWNEAIANHVKVQLSEGAYLCLAAGRFDLLKSVRLENGTMMVIMHEAGYRTVSGDRGEFADELDELRSYLSEDNVVMLTRWEYDQADKSNPVHLFYDDGSEVLVPKSEFDRAFGVIVQVSKGIVMREFHGTIPHSTTVPVRSDACDS